MIYNKAFPMIYNKAFLQIFYISTF